MKNKKILEDVVFLLKEAKNSLKSLKNLKNLKSDIKYYNSL